MRSKGIKGTDINSTSTRFLFFLLFLLQYYLEQNTLSHSMHRQFSLGSLQVSHGFFTIPKEKCSQRISQLKFIH